MATIDLTAAREEDGFVIYFGGRPNEVDTYTFANALVAISDAFQEINAQINPGYSIELRLEATEQGSFKAKVREIPGSVKSAIKWGANVLVMPVLVTLFYENVIAAKTKVIVNTDEVVIEVKGDKIIVPRTAYEKAKSVHEPKRVTRHIARALSAVEDDPHVSSLGIFRDFDTDKSPAILIPRVDFAILREAIEGVDGKRQVVPYDAYLDILKAVFKKGDRKWDFVWNGVKIGATINDPLFMAQVMGREIKIGAGDALDAVLEAVQIYDEKLGVWLNETYRVAHVKRFIPAPPSRQIPLFNPDDFG